MNVPFFMRIVFLVVNNNQLLPYSKRLSRMIRLLQPSMTRWRSTPWIIHVAGNKGVLATTMVVDNATRTVPLIVNNRFSRRVPRMLILCDVGLLMVYRFVGIVTKRVTSPKSVIRSNK